LKGEPPRKTKRQVFGASEEGYGDEEPQGSEEASMGEERMEGCSISILGF
jgi:hypothetical protein